MFAVPNNAGRCCWWWNQWPEVRDTDGWQFQHGLRVDLYLLDQHDQLNLGTNYDDDTHNAIEIIIQKEIVRPGLCKVAPLWDSRYSIYAYRSSKMSGITLSSNGTKCYPWHHMPPCIIPDHHMLSMKPFLVQHIVVWQYQSHDQWLHVSGKIPGAPLSWWTGHYIVIKHYCPDIRPVLSA